MQQEFDELGTNYANVAKLSTRPIRAEAPPGA